MTGAVPAGGRLAAVTVLALVSLPLIAQRDSVRAASPQLAASQTRTIATGPAVEVSRRVLDGRSDDLLTAGLGLAGLRAATPPAFADPGQPTAVELRRRAIWSNWRGLIDLSDGGGVGRAYGPRVVEGSAGKEAPGVAGLERLGALRLAGSRQLDAVMLQVPAGFDPREPCLVAVASSGSRGVYGALPTAGEWGLQQGCAVVTTDKGTGSVFQDGTGRAPFRIDGLPASGAADPLASFVAPEPVAGGVPGPWLWSKHAHSGADPEPRWGERLIESTRVAFDWLNEEYRDRLPRPLEPSNTIVIAAGISNGGAVVLRALELDRGPPRTRWFDGAVVVEPNAIVASVQPRLRLAGSAAGARAREVEVRGLLDYASLHALLQPCALLDPAGATAPLAATVLAGRGALEAWCADLAAHGEVRGADSAARAADARARLLAAGIEPGAFALGPVNQSSQLWLSIVTTYLQSHAAARPGEHPCGLAFAMLDANGRPRAPTDEEWRRLPADGNGIPPGAGVGIVRIDGAPVATPATLRCVRQWVDAALTDGPPPESRGVGQDYGARLRAGLAAVQMRAEPGARPVIVLHGRLDGLIPVNHSSRPWYVAALGREPRAELRYYEIAHGQHFDAFLGLPGFGSAFVPMQPYLLAAMDLMAARLRRGAPLPPSQVLRSRPRAALDGGSLEPLSAANLGAIRPWPVAGDRITLRRGVLTVPD